MKNRRCKVIWAIICCQACLLKRMVHYPRLPWWEMFICHDTKGQVSYVAATTGSFFSGTLKIEKVFY